MRRKAKKSNVQREKIAVIRADDEELNAHRERLEAIAESSEQGCLWLELEGESRA